MTLGISAHKICQVNTLNGLSKCYFSISGVDVRNNPPQPNGNVVSNPQPDEKLNVIVHDQGELAQKQPTTPTAPPKNDNQIEVQETTEL